MQVEFGPRRVLEPSDRYAEIVFGLLMALSFTGSLNIARAGRAELREMLIGVLGCNIAWGIVDGVMYLVTGVMTRRREAAFRAAVREATDLARVRELMAWRLDESWAAALGEDDLKRLQAAAAAPSPAAGGVWLDDLRGAAACFLLVFLGTLPVVVPFLVVREAQIALRVSNAVAVVSLFAMGWSWARASGGRPLLAGLALVLLGLALTGVIVALGG
jgi:VIT1/CCC1 family predicted Fe2+/Mn2+ transporter